MTIKCSLFHSREAKKYERIAKKLHESDSYYKKYCEKLTKNELKKNHKENQEIIKEAEASDPDKAAIDNNVAESITKEENPIKKIDLTNAAEIANKLVKSTLHFLTTKNAKKLNLSELEKEFCNGVSELFRAGKIYEDAGTADLRQYDLDNEKSLTNPKFLVSLKSLYNRNSPELQQKIKNKKAAEENIVTNNNESSSETEKLQQNATSPIIFNSTLSKYSIRPDGSFVITNENEVTKAEETSTMASAADVIKNDVTDEELKKIVEIFGKFIGNREFFVSRRYDLNNNFNGSYLLQVINPRANYNMIIFDLGTYYGFGVPSVICYYGYNGETTPIAVPAISDTLGIIERIFAPEYPFGYHIQTDEEYKAFMDIKECYLFKNENGSVYDISYMFDMSGTENLPKEEVAKLVDKLKYIYGMMIKINRIIRFRFQMVNSAEDFVLESTLNQYSPYAEFGLSGNLISGFNTLIFVKGNDITLTDDSYKTPIKETYIGYYNNPEPQQQPNIPQPQPQQQQVSANPAFDYMAQNGMQPQPQPQQVCANPAFEYMAQHGMQPQYQQQIMPNNIQPQPQYMGGGNPAFEYMAQHRMQPYMMQQVPSNFEGNIIR